ncbi:type II toxin-antitoxin system HicA family toxin [Candidatus Poriferisocius sp.]|uniref:type II toxin-antitoxin system HicA family toxin n=1 Tax=Candidatus Poriferisocius sp. TaxID=3101276 RepID=UPI003B0204D6
MSLPVSRFPAFKPDQVLRLLRRIGYQKVRQRGSHVLLRAEGRRPIILPLHKGRTVKPKHLRAMLADKAGLSDDEIEALL